MEASVLIMKCSSSNGYAGVRVQKMEDGDWYRTWAFKINPKTANHEGYDRTRIHGSLNSTNEFPGCPYCGSRGFYLCNNCDHIVCYNGEDNYVTCPWCGNSARLVSADSFDLNADSF